MTYEPLWQPVQPDRGEGAEHYWAGWEVTSKVRLSRLGYTLQQIQDEGIKFNCANSCYRCRVCKKQPDLKPGRDIVGLTDDGPEDENLWFDIEQGEACENETCRILIALTTAPPPYYQGDDY